MKAYNLQSALVNPLQVTHLYLHKRPMDILPDSVQQCKNLQYLEISECGLVKLPEWIINLTRLQVLVLPGNRIRKLPKSLAQLQVLDLSANQLTTIPPTVWSMHQLRSLTLARNQLEQLSETIQQSQYLEHLDVSENALRRLPAALAKCFRLNMLLANGNQLKTIPKSLYNCSQLQSVDLSDNKIRQLPEGKGWPKLERIRMTGNKLTVIPSMLLHAASLQSLDASSNKIQKLPEKIGQLARLRQLLLSANQLTDLPLQVKALQHLQVLDVSRNPIHSFPLAITKLPALESLDISFTPIRTLPPGLAQVQQLRNLIVRRTAITNRPDILLSLDKLKQLKGIKGSQKIIRFIKACQKAPTTKIDRPTLFAVYNNEPTALKKLGRTALLDALAFPIKAVRDALRKELIVRDGIQQASELEGILYIAGRLKHPSSYLINQMHTIGLTISDQLNNAVKYIILGDRPKEIELLKHAKATFVDEEIIWKALLQQQPRQQLSSKQLQNLANLLLSQQDQNIEIAYQIVQTSGSASELYTELFIAWKTAEQPALRRQLRKLLNRYADPPTREALSLRVGLWTSRSPKALENYLEKLCSGTHLDQEKITRHLHLHTLHSPR